MTLLFFSLITFLINLIYPLETFFWKKFNSNLVPLTFSYPQSLPLSHCIEEYGGEPLNYNEFIRFSSSCDNAGQLYGRIIVTKSQGNENLPTDNFIGSKLKYREINIGNMRGSQLTMEHLTTDERKYSNDSYYYVFAKGYKYEIMIKNENHIINNKIKPFFQSFRF